MVETHYRWDFIGLSTDVKPTPATSEKVVDGSTFYCSDNSKLYVYCKNNWYERKALGGGGGGGSVTVVQTTGNSEDDVMSQKAVTEYLKSSYTLTDIDVNYDPNSTGTDTVISAWTLSSGIYHYNYGNSSLTADIYFGEEDGSPVVASDLGNEAWFLVSSDEDSGTSSIVLFIGTSVITFYNDYSSGDIMQHDAFQTIDGAHLDATGVLETAIRFSEGAPSQYTYAEHIGSFFVDKETCNIYQCTTIDDTDPDEPTFTWTKLSKVSEVIISGTGAPTTATVGTVGLLYEDTTNGDLYQCTDATNPYVWEQVGGGGGGPTVVQTTGSSTTDVMSQDATSRMVYTKVGNNETYAIGIRGNAGPDSAAGAGSIAIGDGAFSRSDGSIAIGISTAVYVSGSYSLAIGNSAKTDNHSRAVAIGNAANAAYDNSVAIGTNAVTTAVGQVNIGAGTSGRGFNNTNYRTISGVHDGQDNHDAATVAQGNTLSTSAPDTSTVGVLGQLWTDTTNMHTYQCTAISGSTYTWTQRW